MIKKIVSKILKKVISKIRFLKFKFLKKPIFFVGYFNVAIEGNALAFSRYLKSRKDVVLVINATNTKEYNKLKSLGYNVVLKGTLSEKKILELSSCIFTVGHTQSDFSCKITMPVLKVMLWHAIPLKAVGLKNKPIPDPIVDYDYVISTSDFTKNIMREAFAKLNTQVIVTGQPKSDLLFENQLINKSDFFKQFDFSTEIKVISYLPTWRHDFTKIENGDFGKNSKILTKIIFSLNSNTKLSNFLEENNICLFIKGHSWDEDKKYEIQNKRIISLQPEDINTEELLKMTDLVITDYSGVMTDWLILNKPVISYAFDVEEYWLNRGNPTFDYSEVFKDIIVKNEEQLVAEIENIFKIKGYKKEVYSNLTKLFHDNIDKNASERICNTVLSRINNSHVS